jgi:hypothetical protein
LDSTEGLAGAALVEHLNSGDSFETGGFTRPVQFAENIPVQVPGGEATRIFNPDVVVLTIEDGTYACVDEGCEFQDMTDLMSSFVAPPPEGDGPPG